MWVKGKRVSTPRPDAPAGGDLLGWRRVQLLRAGFDGEQASRLAADRAIDLHELIGLIDRGCPPATALRILWPLERKEAPC